MFSTGKEIASLLQYGQFFFPHRGSLKELRTGFRIEGFYVMTRDFLVGLPSK